jgi:prophage regulatory protein
METSPPRRRFIRLKEVKARVALSQSRIYDLVSHGEFPRPVKLGAVRKESKIDSRTNYWLENEVDNYIDERIAERNTVA